MSVFDTVQESVDPAMDDLEEMKEAWNLTLSQKKAVKYRTGLMASPNRGRPERSEPVAVDRGTEMLQQHPEILDNTEETKDIRLVHARLTAGWIPGTSEEFYLEENLESVTTYRRAYWAIAKRYSRARLNAQDPGRSENALWPGSRMYRIESERMTNIPQDYTYRVEMVNKEVRSAFDNAYTVPVVTNNRTIVCYEGTGKEYPWGRPWMKTRIIHQTIHLLAVFVQYKNRYREHQYWVFYRFLMDRIEVINWISLLNEERDALMESLFSSKELADVALKGSRYSRTHHIYEYPVPGYDPSIEDEELEKTRPENLRMSEYIRQRLAKDKDDVRFAKEKDRRTLPLAANSREAREGTGPDLKINAAILRTRSNEELKKSLEEFDRAIMKSEGSHD